MTPPTRRPAAIKGTKVRQGDVVEPKRSRGHPPSDDPRNGPGGLRTMLRFDSREAALIRDAYRRSGSDQPLAVWLRQQLLAHVK